MFSILHISDLHRSAEDPISNDELLASLIQDREVYSHESPSIQAPDAIVVSGDLIQGLPLEARDHQSRLRHQYDVALDFLISITNEFVDGDRSRVILTPGNHDVDWNTARASMERVEAPENCLRLLTAPESPYRWSWAERRMYVIKDSGLYGRRLDAFAEMYGEFYQPTSIGPTLSGEAGFNVFELDLGRIGVCAFNSCIENDCFNFAGVVSRQDVSRSFLHWHGNDRRHRLRIAVWHHGIDGPPAKSDYLGTDRALEMIAPGFRLGLHGHQHRSRVAPMSVGIAGEKSIAIAGVGSLCAGPRELPRGTSRQYNLIEINDDYSGMRVHVREMVAVSLNTFGRGRFPELGGTSYADVDWDPILDADQQEIDDRVMRAEGLVKSGDSPGACELLYPHAATLPTYGRQILTEALQATQDDEGLASVLSPPRSIEELTALVAALCRLRRFPLAKESVEKFNQSGGAQGPAARDLHNHIAAEEALANG